MIAHCLQRLHVWIFSSFFLPALQPVAANTVLAFKKVPSSQLGHNKESVPVIRKKMCI